MYKNNSQYAPMVTRESLLSKSEVIKARLTTETKGQVHEYTMYMNTQDTRVEIVNDL